VDWQSGSEFCRDLSLPTSEWNRCEKLYGNVYLLYRHYKCFDNMLFLQFGTPQCILQCMYLYHKKDNFFKGTQNMLHYEKLYFFTTLS
jgi:hypothetical protein